MAFDPRMSEWENPAGAMPRYPFPERIGVGGATRGTETSKYPEEEKSTEIPLVAASERGGGQTARRFGPGGGVGPETWDAGASGTAWEGRRDRVTAPYAKPPADLSGARVPPDT